MVDHIGRLRFDDLQNGQGTSQPGKAECVLAWQLPGRRLMFERLLVLHWVCAISYAQAHACPRVFVSERCVAGVGATPAPAATAATAADAT